MASEPNNAASGWQRILRSLQHRNFRLFFIGQGISLVGTWMQNLAMGWLAYRLTNHNPFLMGMIGFTSQIPSLLLMPFIGVLVDRWNRHRLVIVAQVLSMIQAGLLAWLVMADVITYWQLILLSIFLGCINAIDLPARQTFLSDMVTNREDLANAIALNSSLFNGARLVGPSLAGLLIFLVGESVCFLLNALSYVAVIAALAAMKLPVQQRQAHHPDVLQGLKEGFRYAFGFPPIRAIILLIAMISFMGFPYTVLLPLFAGQVLGGEADTLGYLTTAAGVGALAGTLYLALRSSILGLGSRIVMACILFGVSLMAFSQSTVLWLSLCLMVPAGLGLLVTTAGCNTILQTIVEDDKRGRVMSLFTVAFVGITPFGSLLAGALANWLGTPTTILICGASCLVTALVFGSQLGSLRKLVRPIYVQKGILAACTAELEPISEILLAQEE